jgi:hypothetical protein
VAWSDRVVLTPRALVCAGSHTGGAGSNQDHSGDRQLDRVAGGQLWRSRTGGQTARGCRDDAAGMRELFALLADRPIRWTDQSRPDDEVVQQLMSAVARAYTRHPLIGFQLAPSTRLARDVGAWPGTFGRRGSTSPDRAAPPRAEPTALASPWLDSGLAPGATGLRPETRKLHRCNFGRPCRAARSFGQ